MLLAASGLIWRRIRASRRFMTPQDYTALETALTQHAALETALAHNRDEVTAPILTRLRRENGTLR